MTSCRTRGLTLTLRQHLESSPRGQPESNLKTRERKMHNVHDHRHDQHPHRHVLPLELVELGLSLSSAGPHRTHSVPHSRGMQHNSSTERLTALIAAPHAAVGSKNRDRVQRPAIVGPVPAAHVAHRSCQQVRTHNRIHTKAYSGAVSHSASRLVRLVLGVSLNNPHSLAT